MSPAKAKRAPAGRVVPLLLLGFLLVATGVIWRRSYGLAQSRALAELERKRTTLIAERIRLEGEIRNGRSRARLLPLVEDRLDMRVPPDSNVIILPRPASRPPSSDHGPQ